MSRTASLLAAAALAFLARAGDAAAATDAATKTDATALFGKFCAECHGADRLGRIGPALLPENLSRLRRAKARRVIAAGRPATQMPAFGETLSKTDIEALVELIYTPLATPPRWGLAEIRKSRVVVTDPDTLPAGMTYEADPLNLFVVVETGDHHVTILDGDSFEPIYRFQSRFALHGGPKFTPDGRFVFFASRDGWITKFDLYSLKVVAEIRAGINTRNIAISGDGSVVMAANYLPHTLVALDGRDLAPIEVIPVVGRDGRTSSRVSAVYQARPRGSFVVALKDLAEIWEIPYGGPRATETGAPPGSGRFPIRRIAIREPLDDFFFDPPYKRLIGASRDGGGAAVIDLDAGRRIATIDLAGLPHLGSGITWTYRGRQVMATPHLKESAVSVIDMTTWKTIKRIPTLGPGFFMRSHERTPYAWVDVFFGPNRDALHVIDKRTLEIVATLRPAPGKTAAHVEFTRDGRYALVSIWDMDGALVVYDAATLTEVKRIPMRKPSGKYNVFNKITLSRGTSH